MSGFLFSMKDWLVHAAFGQFQLEAWRAEDRAREECERALRAQYDAARRLTN